MAAAVWNLQYLGMESGESFPGAGNADGKGICLGDEEFINFAYWIGREGYGNGSSCIHIDFIVWSIYRYHY